ncbi:MAG: FkbM family methyltransferase [Anaerolineaceae bacterium]
MPSKKLPWTNAMAFGLQKFEREMSSHPQPNILIRFAKYLNYLHKMRKSDIPVMRKLKKTLKKIYLLGGAANRQHTAEVLDFKVRYGNYATFIYLLETIFFQQEYGVHLSSEPELIIDGGSNIGMSVLFFHQTYPSTRIIAFEPDPRTFQYLRTNITANGLTDLICLHQLALADKQDAIDFFIDPDIEGSLLMSTTETRMPKQKISVRADRLSNFIDEPVDLLKLDIEGSEMQVLTDLKETGKLRMISNMLIEYHHHLHAEEDNLSTLFNLFEAHGFGYQVRGELKSPFKAREFQDLLIFAYRKT